VQQPGATRPAPAPTGSTNDFIDITSQNFEYLPDRAIFRGQVQARETEGNLTCGVLTVIFSESGAVERIEAEEDVVLVQGTTRASADRAVYLMGQNQQVVEFTGHAVWTDGQGQGSGERVSFDRLSRTLLSENKAYLKVPRAALGEAGLFTATPTLPDPSLPQTTNAFVEVFSERMTIQLPPTNGPIQRFVAEKSVLIVDAGQDGRAMADLANYENATGILELTGSPMLETAHRLLIGKMFRVDRATRILTASPDAYLKLPAHALGQLGFLTTAASNLPPGAVATTNRFIEVWCKTFEYHTNLLRFVDHVRANFLDGEVALGKLTCDDSLTVRFGQQLENMVAEQNVEVEQFKVAGDPHPVSRRVNCQRLRAEFSREGRLTLAVAEAGVAAEQEEMRPGEERPTFDRLTAETATAFFSPLTNRVDRVVAEKDVVFTQDKRIFRGAKAVYTDVNAWMELTGQPTATMPEGRITEADRLIWDRLHQRFIGRGNFKSAWKRPAPRTNQVDRPTAQAR
jgi:lipopolysaccharide export system protein LptA